MHDIRPQPYGIVIKGIMRKKRKLLKSSLAQGQQDAAKLSGHFIDQWQTMVKKLYAAKIDCVDRTALSLVHGALEHDPELIVPMVLKLLKNFAEHTDVELTTGKIDAHVIRKSLNEIAQANASLRKITITEDDTYKRGSLVIKANKSIIDAHINTQINKAKEILVVAHGSSC